MSKFRLNAGISVVIAVITGCHPDASKATFSSPQVQQSANNAIKLDAPVTGNTSSNKAYITTKSVAPLGNTDSVVSAEVQKYINRLVAKGFVKENQGIWIQSGRTLLANYQGTIPLPAASITKVATTLVALQTWGPKHQFVTLLGATGPILDGVLHGDLVIQGGEDPFFIWEDAIALGNILNQMGIKRVNGNLLVVGKFYMNYNPDPFTSGSLLKLGLNTQIWPKEAKTQYLTMPKSTPQPQIVIAGSVQFISSPPEKLVPLLRHFSLPLAKILKQMNLYSNNMMAEMLADAIGGAKVVAQKAAKAALVPTGEIQLKNGSGATENRISPRAACAMFLAIENYLQPYKMSVADVFAISRQDVGILKDRPLPPLSVVKTGTVGNISAIAGVMPTQKQGFWFAIMNLGEDKKELEIQQDIFLKNLLNQWGTTPSEPALNLNDNNSQASRTQVLYKYKN